MKTFHGTGIATTTLPYLHGATAHAVARWTGPEHPNLAVHFPQRSLRICNR